jgi:hypothetical protein
LTSLIEKLSYPPDEVDLDGKTPLMTACVYGHLPIVRYLTEMHHVDTCHEGESPSIHPLSLDQPNAYSRSSDKKGMTPILLASLMGHVNIVSYFHHLSPQLVLISCSFSCSPHFALALRLLIISNRTDLLVALFFTGLLIISNRTDLLVALFFTGLVSVEQQVKLLTLHVR